MQFNILQVTAVSITWVKYEQLDLTLLTWENALMNDAKTDILKFVNGDREAVVNIAAVISYMILLHMMIKEFIQRLT